MGDVHPKTSVFDNGFACGVVTISYPNFLRSICAAFKIVGVNCIVPMRANQKKQYESTNEEKQIHVSEEEIIANKEKEKKKKEKKNFYLVSF